MSLCLLPCSCDVEMFSAIWASSFMDGDAGIPAASLSQLGINGYSCEALLPISVQGSLQKPKVGWVE